MIYRLSKQSVAGIVVLTIALLAILCESVITFRHLPKPPLANGTMAPQFQLASFSGGQVSLDQFRGRPVVVMFWSGIRWRGRWFPELYKISKEFTNDQAPILMVSVFQNSTYLGDWFRVSAPVLNDRKAEVSQTYHAYNRPVIYLIDKEGKISKSWVRDSEGLKKSINALLSQAAEAGEPDANEN